MANLALQPDFDPWTQNITFFYKDGTNATASFKDLDNQRLYGSRAAINYGSQIGASMMLLLMLLLLTRSAKRRSSIFLINAFCLFTNMIRCILLCTYFTSSIWNPFSQVSGDWTRVKPSDLAAVVAANLLTLLITLLVYVSLSLQVWVVCITTRPLQRYIIMAVISTMACIAFGIKAAVIIYNIKAIVTYEDITLYENLIGISYVVQAIAIWTFSCVFTYKLGYAIMERRRLNMPQFGPIQVVFIMGCQTMLVPAIFTSLQFSSWVPEFGTQVLTIVCIFLPLSAIWAGVLNEASVGGSGPDSHQRLIHNDFYRSTVNSSNASTTAWDKSRQMSRQMSVCTHFYGKDIGCTVITPGSRMESINEVDVIHVDSEFGFSHGDTTCRI